MNSATKGILCDYFGGKSIKFSTRFTRLPPFLVVVFDTHIFGGVGELLLLGVVGNLIAVNEALSRPFEICY